MNETVERKLHELPDSPGCYIMKHQGEVIYVGKAVNLKNRVRQYFHHSADHTPKVRAMVEKIDDFDTVLVGGELEALILECNLIKRYRPWYNILLKDDKHYPFLRLDPNEPFPRLTLVRRPEKDGCKYFGPYPGATAVREVMDVVRVNFPLRTCAHKLPLKKPIRPCVHYEIGQCLAPCAGKVSEDAYAQVVKNVVNFLNGHAEGVVQGLTEEMRQAARAMQFERAATLRDRIQAIEDVMQKQKAMIAGGGDRDVLYFTEQGDDAYVQQLVVREGRIIGSENRVFERCAGEEPGSVLSSFMLQYYGNAVRPPREILVSHDIPEEETLSELLTETRGAKVTVRVPQRGEARQLMDIAAKNARENAQKREARLKNSYERTDGAARALGEVLGLGKMPVRIEGYDISNTQGAQSVGSMVVMKHGLASRKDYRIFRIRTVEGANDYASMKETIERRLSHGLREIEERAQKGLPPEGGSFSELPDVILIDGGRGQLNAALEGMEAAGISVPAFGLAKRLEEIVLPDQEESILLDRHSPALHLIERVRDEAHRFGITRHRALRTKASMASRLDEIEGVGPKRKKALLTRFKTVEALLEADVETLTQAEGISEKTARAVYEALHGEETERNGGGAEGQSAPQTP